MINKEFKSDILENISMVNINIDLLISIIENVNKFNKPFSEFADIFNYKFEKYKYKLYFINDSNEKEFLSYYLSEKRPKSGDRYIFDLNVVEIIKLTDKEVEFKSWHYDQNNNNKKTLRTYIAQKIKGIDLTF